MNLRIKGTKATAVGALLTACTLSACVTTEQQADGSTRVRVSVNDALGRNQAAPAPAPVARSATTASTGAASPSKVAKTQTPVAASAPAVKPLSAAYKARLAVLMMCKDIKSFTGKTAKAREDAQSAFGQAIYGFEDIKSEVPGGPLTVYGLPVSHITLDTEGYEAVYTSHFQGVTKQQLIKAAGLKLGRDKKTYYVAPKKGGELTLQEKDGEFSFECVYVTENY